MTRFWIFLFLIALIFPFEASASDVFVSEMCNVINIVFGPAGKVFAAFAIVSVGIGFFTGKVSWGLLVGVSVGTAAMFGAPSIVSAITDKPTFQCSNTTYYGACVNGVCPCPTGFTGITCNTCSTGYTGASCNICDSGYSSVNGTCKKSCNISSTPGVNQISVLHGSTSTACNVANYSGSINYTCDDGSFTLASGSSCFCSGNYAGANCSSCATGYTGTNCGTCNTGYTQYNGSCQQDCLVRDQVGINDTTVIPGTGTISCTSPATGLVDYNCSGGNFSITSGSCALKRINSDCFNISEGGTLTMTAPAGKVWEGVTFASYGLPNSCVVSSCNAANSMEKISDACSKKTTCSISAINEIFFDPCLGTGKRLQVILYYY